MASFNVSAKVSNLFRCRNKAHALCLFFDRILAVDLEIKGETYTFAVTIDKDEDL